MLRSLVEDSRNSPIECRNQSRNSSANFTTTLKTTTGLTKRFTIRKFQIIQAVVTRPQAAEDAPPAGGGDSPPTDLEAIHSNPTHRDEAVFFRVFLNTKATTERVSSFVYLCLVFSSDQIWCFLSLELFSVSLSKN